MTVVLTGAAGDVGTVLRAGLSARGTALRSSDVRPIASAALAAGEEFKVVDLTDAVAVIALMEGAEAVIHLGGVADEAAFDVLAGPNLHGAFHVFEAARRAGVGRVVYASSNRITGLRGTSEPLTGAEPVAPDGLYGATKAFGEALAAMYAGRFGMDVVSIRIGSFEARPSEPRHLSTWLSHRDAVALFAAALDAPAGFGHVIVYGVSANTRSWWPPGPGARRIGYVPQDDAEAFAADLAGADGPPAALQGGAYAAPSYGGWADAPWPSKGS
ncbi:Uronate dehydrogenase [Baekduia alba]|uniref:NAD-dependent epimerase/dehydratase family protein n=1 Tax=Baekduia alba TaxID=2997333 RepID=UPI0023400C93|nr:NAD(P)-dependent oxidoreductase [Baekduia alba]WCB95323.1 Uronate dehydrogenase [Baekduia alba]